MLCKCLSELIRVTLNKYSHRLLYTWIGHEIFRTDIRVVMGSNGSKISKV